MWGSVNMEGGVEAKGALGVEVVFNVGRSKKVIFECRPSRDKRGAHNYLGRVPQQSWP